MLQLKATPAETANEAVALVSPVKGLAIEIVAPRPEYGTKVNVIGVPEVSPASFTPSAFKSMNGVTVTVTDALTEVADGKLSATPEDEMTPNVKVALAEGDAVITPPVAADSLATMSRAAVFVTTTPNAAAPLSTD
jgi:hypothetical protein